MQTKPDLRHTRVLLKLSGEALADQSGSGVSVPALRAIVEDVLELRHLGVELAIVIGGGNFWRGEKVVSEGFERVTADQMGMLFTVANGLALRSALHQAGAEVALMSAVAIPGFVDIYDQSRALSEIASGKILLFTAGVGSPFFSTDSAAALRAIEINADIILKASTVDGVYSADPKIDAGAVRYEHLNYETAISQQLRVMDLTAICLCQDHDMPIRVFDMRKTGAIKNIVQGRAEGTLISN